MASTKDYLNFILEQLSDLDDVSFRPMMREYLIYYKGKYFGGIFDNRFLIKPAKSAFELLPDAKLETPYDGAKDMLLVNEVDDKHFLTELIEAVCSELPDTKK